MHSTKLKRNWLGDENYRNSQCKDMYIQMLQLAYGCKVVVIGHHLVPVVDPDTNSVEEIPSADTALFDHCIAERIIGPGFKAVLAKMAQLPASEREAFYQPYVDAALLRAK